MSDVFASDPLSHRVGERAEAMVGGVSVPTLQRDGLDFAEAKRRLGGVKADWQIDSTPLRAPCLFADEMTVMANRALAPGNDYAPGGVEMLLDVLVPVRSAADVGIPPDGEALGLQRLDE